MEPRSSALRLAYLAALSIFAVGLLARPALAQSDGDPTDWTVDPFEGEDDEDDEDEGDGAGGATGSSSAAPGLGARLWVDLAYHTQKQMGTRLHPFSVLFGARLVADDTVALELRMPTVLLQRNNHMDDEFAVMSPSLTGLWQFDLMEGMRAEVGLGVSLPSDAETGLQQAAFAFGAMERGLWDIWLYTPDTLGIPIPFRLTFEHDPIVAGANVELGILVPREERREGMNTGDTDAYMQFRYWLAYQLDALQLGMRFQHVVGLTIGTDKHQSSILPFAEHDLGHGLFAGGGILVNLDAPAGFVDGPSEGVWALRGWAGARL